MISIHAPTKGATPTYRTLFMLQAISIHAPTKGATGKLDKVNFICIFQSTLPRRERHIRTIAKQILKNNFNPRSHEGSDFSTFPLHDHSQDFNPRSHEGSDLQFATCFMQKSNFNPRSHEGSDSNFIQFYILYFSISINLYQYFPSYFLSLPSPYNFCTFILVRVLLYYRVYLPFAQQSYNKNIIC